MGWLYTSTPWISPANQHFGRISAWNEEAPIFAGETSVLEVFDVKQSLENWKLSPEPSKGEVGTCDQYRLIVEKGAGGS